MIYESWPWKQEVLKYAKKLERRCTQKRWPEASLVTLEKEVFFSAFAVRKLRDSYKLSDEVEGRSLDVRLHARRGDRTPDVFNRGDFHRFYDLENSTPHRIGLAEYTNVVIHSFVFTGVVGDGGLDGIFIASDRQRRHELLYVPLGEIVGALNAVGEDDIISMLNRRDPKSKEMKILQKSNKLIRLPGDEPVWDVAKNDEAQGA